MDSKPFLSVWQSFGIVLMMLLLPLCGIWIAGKEPWAFLEFPPVTRYVEHAGFSWFVFIVIALCVVAVFTPFLVRVVLSSAPQKGKPGYPFPFWGWVSIMLCLVSWVLAWTRFDWFSDYQIFTFSPLWFAYIGIVNAFTFTRSGRCMLLNRPKYLIRLFMVSALFWWSFEYLNRFVQNWYYVGIEDLSPGKYVLFATLSFSTVLPAVLGTCELLETFPFLYSGLHEYKTIDIRFPKATALMFFMLATAGLFGIGIYPNYLYPLLWISPLFIIISIQVFAGMETLFTPLKQGNWKRIFLLAVSALICGFFWEMWNYFSYAKWIYSIPFVQSLHIFEMPLLGYAGYLSFGLECGVIADLCLFKNDH